MAQSTTTSTITSRVEAADGTPVSGVTVGLFGVGTVLFDRGEWMRDTLSGADGSVSFGDLEVGCYKLTYIAPDGRSFSNGSQYLTSDALCFNAEIGWYSVNPQGTVDLGPVGTAPPATVLASSDTGTISGAIRPAVAGATIEDVSVGVFRANADGTRGDWVRDIVTVDKAYRVQLAPGCYILTFVAGPGYAFANGGGYASTGSLCVVKGSEVNGADASMAPLEEFATLSAIQLVLALDYSLPPTVYFGLFEANSDGSRGAWLQDFAGLARVRPGCYVVTFTAPDGMISEKSGTGYENSEPICVARSEQVEILGFFDRPQNLVNVSGTVRSADGAPVPGVRVSIFEASSTGFPHRGQWLRDVTTDANGNYSFQGVLKLCHYVTFVAPPGRSFGGEPYFTTIPCADSGSVTGVDARLS